MSSLHLQLLIPDVPLLKLILLLKIVVVFIVTDLFVSYLNILIVPRHNPQLYAENDAYISSLKSNEMFE